MTTAVRLKYYFKKSGKSTGNVWNYRSLRIEISKTLGDINPSLKNRPTREKYKPNLGIAKSN